MSIARLTGLAWSPDDAYLASAVPGCRSHAATLQGFPGPVVIGWSPDSRWLTFVVTPVPEPTLPC